MTILEACQSIQDILMDINLAIPCGLIANEVISNALKHAFPNQSKGEVSVELFMNHDDEYNLIISDNGKPFESAPNLENPNTLGLQLVGSLVKQIHGEIKFVDDGIKSFVITFKNVELSTYSGIKNQQF